MGPLELAKGEERKHTGTTETTQFSSQTLGSCQNPEIEPIILIVQTFSP